MNVVSVLRRAVLKRVPSWNMFQIGMVWYSEKCALLKHVSDCYCANFIILKPHVKCKVLRHTKMCAKRPHVKQAAFCLFVCFSVINAGLLQMQWLIKTYCCLPSIWKVCTVPIWYMFQKYTFSERHTRPIWNMFQNGTCFRTARNTFV